MLLGFWQKPKGEGSVLCGPLRTRAWPGLLPPRAQHAGTVRQPEHGRVRRAAHPAILTERACPQHVPSLLGTDTWGVSHPTGSQPREQQTLGAPGQQVRRPVGSLSFPYGCTDAHRTHVTSHRPGTTPPPSPPHLLLSWLTLTSGLERPSLAQEHMGSWSRTLSH